MISRDESVTVSEVTAMSADPGNPSRAWHVAVHVRAVPRQTAMASGGTPKSADAVDVFGLHNAAGTRHKTSMPQQRSTVKILVAQAEAQRLTGAATAWVLGGDFNLDHVETQALSAEAGVQTVAGPMKDQKHGDICLTKGRPAAHLRREVGRSYGGASDAHNVVMCGLWELDAVSGMEPNFCLSEADVAHGAADLGFTPLHFSVAA